MKKSFFMLLACAITLPTASLAFNDVVGLPEHQAVKYLQENQVVQGFADGTYKPAKNLTRAEFLKISLEAEGSVAATCESETTFSDVPKDQWFYKYVCAAVNDGIIQGYADGTFRPHESINYRDAAKIVTEVFDMEAEEATGEWFSGYLAELEQQKVVPASVQASGDLLTRGEMAQMVWGLETGFEVDHGANADELPMVESCEAFEAQLTKFEKRQQQNRTYNTGFDDMMMVDEAMDLDMEMEDAAPMPMDADSASGASMNRVESAADDFSGTNVQEEGIDEADIIKNDGSHIFMIKNQTISIIRAYPADEMDLEAAIILDSESPIDMYVDGDRLTVISRLARYYDTPMPEPMMEIDMMDDRAMPYYGGGEMKTRVLIYDISDRGNPSEVREVTLDGRYVSSRRIDDNVYVATDNGWNIYGMPRPLPIDEILPQISDSAADEPMIVGCPDIHYVPNFEQASFLLLAAINTRNTESSIEKTAVLGAGDQVYASLNNFYITRTGYEMPTTFRGSSREVTEIYRFALDETDVEFNGKGEVDGRVLNQFAMSESGEYFRVATQLGQAWGNTLSESRITILNDELDKVSEVSGIAPGENLKAARFMGNRAYLITFKTVDPLFVVDLTPNNPQILGKLKIPGWSDYLHPVTENVLMGFGKEVDESIDADKVHSDNAVYFTAVQGMKLALYDVTDPENPIETHKTVIGDRGTTSEVLTNHKALLFSADKGIVGFPITITENQSEEVGVNANIQTIFAGAHLYDFSLEDGFALRGAVSHYEDDDAFLKSGEYFYGNPELNIKRMIYIGENFYTISTGMIKALGWDELGEEEKLELE
jgi:uncharacterized secreted protein with C-terminal beta-propeller domain